MRRDARQVSIFRIVEMRVHEIIECIDAQVPRQMRPMSCNVPFAA